MWERNIQWQLLLSPQCSWHFLAKMLSILVHSRVTFKIIWAHMAANLYRDLRCFSNCETFPFDIEIIWSLQDLLSLMKRKENNHIAFCHEPCGSRRCGQCATVHVFYSLECSCFNSFWLTGITYFHRLDQWSFLSPWVKLITITITITLTNAYDSCFNLSLKTLENWLL